MSKIVQIELMEFCMIANEANIMNRDETVDSEKNQKT